MKLILRKTVEKLGNPGDVVEVKRGYGSNFLIPGGLALAATEQNLKKVEVEKCREVDRKKKELDSAEALAEKLSAGSLTIPVVVGEDEKMFGSVTSIDIVKAFEQEEIKVERHDILLEEPIRVLGVYNVKVKLHQKVEAVVKVWVVKK